MRFASLVLVMIVAVAGIGIKYDHDRQAAKPPFWDNPCVQSHTDSGTTMTLMSGGVGIPIGGGMSMLPTSTSSEVCERRMWVCNTGGKNYKGEHVCPPKPPGEPAP